MRKTTRQAARTTVQPARAAVLTIDTMLVLTALLITATATGAIAVVGAGLLPETVTPDRRITGPPGQAPPGTEWTGERSSGSRRHASPGRRPAPHPAAHRGPRPDTLMDLRWMFAQYG
ncbi:hypothetical protein [Streptomyces phaeochromogenes]|uniref:hypothetical protein n=1 Tax=Streptomyces phaeochromogenes TaxID=1923 RepID=UPI002E0E614A